MDAPNIILEIIKELRQDSSLNYKKDILRKYSDYEPFQKFLVYVYNPRVNYFLKKLPDVISYGHGDHSIIEMYSLLEQLKLREIAGNQAQEAVREYLLNTNQVIREIFELVIGRDIRAGVGVGIINEVYKGLVEEIPYQRCSKLDEKTIARFDTMLNGFLTQAKLDGQFSYIIKANDTVTMLTRAGTVWTSDSLKEDMINCPEGVYIGEALVYKDKKPLDRKTSNGLLNKFIKKECVLESLKDKLINVEPNSTKYTKIIDEYNQKEQEYSDIEHGLIFVIWDSLTLSEFEEGISTRPYTKRQGEAIRVCFLTSRLKPVPSFRVYSIKEAQAIADDYISEGGEGAIIKKLDSVWKEGTSKDLVKIKAVLDADLICVGVDEGSGKYKNKIGALILETLCGRLSVKVGTGLSDVDREKPFEYYIGKVIEIQYNEFIKSKNKSKASLFLPRFIDMREDKNITTNYEELVR